VPNTALAGSPDVDSSSRERILATAADEFGRKGFAAARVDVIAQRAGVNKQLMYYYFGSKAGLYDAVIERMVQTFRPKEDSGASEAGFAEFFDALAPDAYGVHLSAWRRLLAWEGIEYGASGDAQIRHVEERIESYRAPLTVVQRALANGELPAGVDARGMMLLMVFTAVLPDALPQITRLITGLDADDPAMRQRLQDTVRRLMVTTEPKEFSG
jgi:TetR/AcrR family transcriptional regulator